MAKAVAGEYGIIADYNLLTRSRSFRDQPFTPLETAIFWVEYVIRHGGAPHLRNAGMDLNFIQYHNIDVFAVIGAVLLISSFILYKCVKKIDLIK
uniref:Uncharacterized protein n=1 Tax=Megaselia scalaris TaxID=36166 RepID=T1GTV6_MEGSC